MIIITILEQSLKPVHSLGVDTFENDPICEFGLTTDGFASIGSAIAALMKPTLFAMEG